MIIYLGGGPTPPQVEQLHLPCGLEGSFETIQMDHLHE